MREDDPSKQAEGRVGGRQGEKAQRSVTDPSHQCHTSPGGLGWGLEQRGVCVTGSN